MEKLSVHQRSLKQAKPKKKLVKVVYISDPMRVKATASQFKGLVQELTGQYSDIADRTKFADLEQTGEAAADQGSCSTITDDYLVTDNRPGFGKEELRHQRYHHHQQHLDGPRRSTAGTVPFDSFGEVFAPAMLDNLDSLVPASTYYELSPPVHNIWGLDIA